MASEGHHLAFQEVKIRHFDACLMTRLLPWTLQGRHKPWCRGRELKGTEQDVPVMDSIKGVQGAGASESFATAEGLGKGPLLHLDPTCIQDSTSAF